MIVIDTHIWVWAVQDFNRLSARQAEAIKQATDGVYLSAISLWEVAMLIDRGRIQTQRKALDWINAALSRGPISVIDLTPQIACQSFDLPTGFHRDPADRLITATALVLDLPLVTSDKQIIEHRDITTIY